MAGPRPDERRRHDAWPGILRRPAEDDPLLEAPEHDIDRREQRPEHLGGLRVGPQPPTQVDVERDREVVRLGPIDGLEDRLPARRGERRRDAREMEEPGTGEQPISLRGVHVLGTEARAGRSGTVVHDLRRPGAAPLADHQAGPRVRLRAQPADVHAVAAEASHDRRPEAVVADPADERGGVAEAGEADGDVRLRPRHVAVEGAHLGQRSGRGGDERDEALAERHDLDAVRCRAVCPSERSGARARPSRSAPRPGGASSTRHGRSLPFTIAAWT